MKWFKWDRSKRFEKFLNSPRSFFSSVQTSLTLIEMTTCCAWDETKHRVIVHSEQYWSTASELSHRSNSRRSDLFFSFPCALLLIELCDYVISIQFCDSFHGFSSSSFSQCWLLMTTTTTTTTTTAADTLELDLNQYERSTQTVARWLNYFSGALCTKRSTTTGDQWKTRNRSVLNICFA